MRVDNDGVAFTDLVAEVKAAVRRAGLSPGSGIVVTELTLSTTVQAKQTAGGRVDLTVPVVGLKAGGGFTRTRDDTQRIEVTLTPPARKNFEVRGGTVERALTEAITTVRSTLAAAAAGDDPFVLKTSTVTLTFVVTDSGSVKLIGEGALTDEVTQSLTLTLGPRTTPDQVGT